MDNDWLKRSTPLLRKKGGGVDKRKITVKKIGKNITWVYESSQFLILAIVYDGERAWIGTHALVTAKTFFFKYKDILGKTGRVLTRQIAKSKLLSL